MTIPQDATVGFPIPVNLECVPIGYFEKFTSAPVYIFLDYDGTLTPIVENPAEAVLSHDVLKTLYHLADIYPLSIVTGRGRECVQRFLGPELVQRVAIAASHGFDIHLRSGEYLHTGDSRRISQFREFKSKLGESIGLLPRGCSIEDTGYSASIHYRHVESSLHHVVEEAVDRMLKPYPGLIKCRGKMVFEARLDIDWGKGKAVEWILKQTEADTEKGYVIYLGDDVTDEDAFRSLKQFRNHMCVIVSDSEDFGRPTLAEYRLRDQEEVLKFLQNLIRVKSLSH
jgi:trehalose-phosphatase